MMSKHPPRLDRAAGADATGVPITDGQTGFIHHRRGIPLDYKRFIPRRQERMPAGERGSVGLLFETWERPRPGAFIELAITVQGKPEKLRGKVVMVRERDGYYDVGLWLGRHEDACRARILEQSCYIEEYIQEKKFREGPFILNRDHAAAEWIRKYAADLPG